MGQKHHYFSTATGWISLCVQQATAHQRSSDPAAPPYYRTQRLRGLPRGLLRKRAHFGLGCFSSAWPTVHRVVPLESAWKVVFCQVELSESVFRDAHSVAGHVSHFSSSSLPDRYFRPLRNLCGCFRCVPLVTGDLPCDFPAGAWSKKIFLVAIVILIFSLSFFVEIHWKNNEILWKSMKSIEKCQKCEKKIKIYEILQ